MTAKNELREKIEEMEKSVQTLRTYEREYNVSFMDGKEFMQYIHGLISRAKNPMTLQRANAIKRVDASGYFSEGVCDLFSEYARSGTTVRLITRIEKNDKAQAVLKRLQMAGVQIRTNERIHARMLIIDPERNGTLVLGSFDFNREGLSGERRDAGIITRNPNLVESATNFFESVWNELETKNLSL